MADTLADINYQQLANPFAGLIAQRQQQVALAAQDAAQVQQQVFAQQNQAAQNAAYMERAKQREDFDLALEKVREINAEARSDKDRENRLKELGLTLDAHMKQAVLLKYGGGQNPGESWEQTISRKVAEEAKKNTDLVIGYRGEIKKSQDRLDTLIKTATQKADARVASQALSQAATEAKLTPEEMKLGNYDSIYKNLAGNRATKQKADAFRVAHDAALAVYQTEENRQKSFHPDDLYAIQSARRDVQELRNDYVPFLKGFGGNFNKEAFDSGLPELPPPEDPEKDKWKLPPLGAGGSGVKAAPVGGIAPIPRNEIIAQIAEKLGVPNARPVDVLPGLGRNMLRARPLTDPEAQALGVSMLPELDRRMRASRGSGAKEYYDAINLIQGVPSVPVAPQSQIFTGNIPPEYAPYSAPSFTPLSGAEDLPQF